MYDPFSWVVKKKTFANFTEVVNGFSFIQDNKMVEGFYLNIFHRYRRLS